MKVSLNWVKQFTDIDISVDELVAKIGAQLGAVEEVINIGAQYKSIIVAKVVVCEKHPNADKLSVCRIDDGGATSDVNRGDDGLIEVVCGAPNVAAGMLVAWIPPGATVPSTYAKDPFVLEARELRGVVSNGMIASAKELAVGDAHDGILEIDIEASPGMSFADLYELNDYIIDIENKMFTHRPDCFGILGVAREIAGIQNKQFVSPDWYARALDRIKPGKTKSDLVVKNEAKDLVPRFMAVAMAEVSVKPSPVIIQSYLTRVGIKPINNIVDVTNYLMVLTGQPTHAYDYDKLVKAQGSASKTPSLEARKSHKGEKLKLLNGKTITFEDETSVVIAANGVAVGVGGIMGGADTEVDDATKNIIVECGNFNMYNIRKTSMKYGLFTDAVSRFNKGQSPLQNDIVLEEAVATLQYVSGAHVASKVFDESADIKKPEPVEVDSRFINDRLGLSLEQKDITRRLENVEMTINSDHELLIVQPPYWRTDLQIPEDIVEEVGRLIGYDALPHVLPTRGISPVKRNAMIDLKQRLRSQLASMGANEVLSYSFVHKNLLDAVGQDIEQAYKLSNALSPDLQYYRMSVLPSLLEKVYPNLRSDYVRMNAGNEFALFEIGKAHIKGVHDPIEPDVPYEFQQLAFVVAADDKTAADHNGASYYRAQAYLRGLFEREGLDLRLQSFDEAEFDEHAQQRFAGFEQNRTAIVLVRNTPVGVVGEFNAKTRKALKLPVHTAGFVVDIDQLLEYVEQPTYTAIPKFPKVSQDLTLRVSKDTAFAELQVALQQALLTTAGQDMYVRYEPLGMFSKGDKTKNISFRFWAIHHNKSLRSEEVNSLLDKLAETARQHCGAERV